MLCVRTEAPRGLRWGIASIAVVIALTAITSDPGDARGRRKRVSYRHAQNFDARYAAIVVDGNSGSVLHAANPDALRHPASLTKIMTLYLLFERLEQGKIKLDSQMQVSEHASEQSPTKLGLREGSTLQVEDAIKGIVTRSANDAAVVIGEALAGDEDDFAELMTKKAKSLGMSRTVYRNASGLPDDEQVTTARDQAVLGRAIQERFPKYYKYFSTHSFSFRGQTIGNHNRLLGSVEGVDGIKTGYTRASGYNLVTSLHRNNKFLVAVVLGGPTAGTRDARMRDLISTNIVEASVKRTAPTMVAEAEGPKPETAKAESKTEAKSAPQGFAMASAKSMPVTLAPRGEPMLSSAAAPKAAATPNAGSTDPIRPVMVRTLSVKPGLVHTASAVPMPTPAPAAETPAKSETPVARAGLFGAFPSWPPRSTTGSVAEVTPAATPNPPASAVAAAPAARTQSHSGWFIQVGAYPAEGEAKQRLSTVQGKAGKVLAGTDPFTETVQKGDKTYYRARFAGFDKDKAEAACKYLKRNDVDCMTVKN